jgi:hypothetical protein
MAKYLTQRQADRLDTIHENFINGNRELAATQIKRTTKQELFALVADRTSSFEFVRFVGRVLNKEIFD